MVYVGADHLISPSVLIGALVQYDWMNESGINSSASGVGFMAGPYMSAKLAPELYFDARLAWGTSGNTIRPFGTYEDAFSTHRWLAQAKLTGNWVWENFRLTPSLGHTYIEERQRAYTDSLGVFIPAQTIALGRVTFGPEIAQRYVALDGTNYEAQLALHGIWDYLVPSRSPTSGGNIHRERLHAIAQAGILVRRPSGVSFRAAITYDGIGRDVRSYGLHGWLNVPLN